MSTPLKIVQLQSENIKALKAVSITPKGDTVVISGRNAQGKTSVLDSIEFALAGKDSICEEPIRKGQQKARIVCDLGDIVVERTFSANSGDSALRVRTKDGRPVKAPQAMLDELCSHVAFDPLSFVRMKPAEQVATLSKLVGIDLTDLNQKRAKAYGERELKGRELRSAKAALDSFPFHADAPEQEVDIKAASEKLQAIRKQREQNALVRNALNLAKMKVASITQAIADTNAEIERLEKRLTECRSLVAGKDKELLAAKMGLTDAELASSKLVEDDEQSTLSEIANAEAINRNVRENREHQKQNERVQQHQFEYDKLTAEIEAVDQEKADRLTWAEFPLEGLSFDDSRVLLHGVPFTQCSQAQQLQAAVAIGLALNPKVRVILIRDASLLDDDSMRLVGELAVKHNAQIWMEIVNSKDPAAVVIEAGEVKE